MRTLEVAVVTSDADAIIRQFHKLASDIKLMTRPTESRSSDSFNIRLTLTHTGGILFEQGLD